MKRRDFFGVTAAGAAAFGAERAEAQRREIINPKTELEKLIAEYATRKTGGVDLEVLKQNAELSRKTADKDYNGIAEPEEGVAKVLYEKAKCFELKYKVLTLLKQEVALWEKNVKNTKDENVQAQLLKAGGEIHLEFTEINGKLNRVARHKALGFTQTPDRAEQEIVVQLSGFASEVKSFIRKAREYYVSKGGNIVLSDPDEEFRFPRF